MKSVMMETTVITNGKVAMINVESKKVGLAHTQEKNVNVLMIGTVLKELVLHVMNLAMDVPVAVLMIV